MPTSLTSSTRRSSRLWRVLFLVLLFLALGARRFRLLGADTVTPTPPPISDPAAETLRSLLVQLHLQLVVNTVAWDRPSPSLPHLEVDRQLRVPTAWSTGESVGITAWFITASRRRWPDPQWRHPIAFVLAHELAHGYLHQSLLPPPPRGLASLAQSRHRELEADVLGARLACQCGFDPDAGRRIFQLTGEIPSWEQASVASYYYLDRLSALWSTHPAHAERSGRLAAEAKRCAQRQNQGTHRRPLASPAVLAHPW